MKRFLSVLFMFVFYALNATGLVIEGPQTFYAGRESSIAVKTGKDASGNLSWNISYSGAPIASGEQEISESRANIKFTFPETKPCVIAKAEFNCFIGNEKLQKNLFFYPPNPFTEKKKFFEDLSIEVWHTEADKGITELFKSLEIPFAEISNFSESKGKVLIIVGIDFSNFPGISDNLLKISSGGARIIIINPVSGRFPLKTAELTEAVLAKNGKIKEFGKNFDDESWGGKTPSSKSLKLASSDGVPVLETDTEQKDFTYCRMQTGKGNLIICAWDIINLSKDSPTPLYLLDRLISEDFNKKDHFKKGDK